MIIELCAVVLLTLSLKSLRVLNKTTVHFSLAPLYTCLGVMLATVILLVFGSTRLGDLQTINPFADEFDWKDL